MSPKITFVRTMPHFSMDVYANGLIEGLKTHHPSCEIVELVPRSFNRDSYSLNIRMQKAYERFWRFPKEVQQQSTDIFHIVDHSDAHIVRWLKKTGKPVVVTCHDLINFVYPENLQSSVRLPIISDILARYSIEAMKIADFVIAVSSETAKNIDRILKIDSACIAVIPNAVQSDFHQLPAEQSQALRLELSTNPDTFCLLNVGGNHPRKNLIGILKALKILSQKDIPIQLWKVSENFNDEDWDYIQTNNLGKYIKYLGYPDKSRLTQIYNAADVLVAPSFHEGFGITLIEAMACGIPVITSNVSAMPEVVGDAGILVDPKDSKAIADAVFCLYNNPTYYQKLRNKGIKRVKSFTWGNIAEQTIRVYQELLK